MAEDNSSDNIVSLADLVTDEPKAQATIAGAPVPPSGAAEGSSAVEPDVKPLRPSTNDDPSLADIEAALALEDPEFAASMNELKAKPEGDAADGAVVEIDSLDIESIVADERAVAQAHGVKKLILVIFVRPFRKVAERSARAALWLKEFRASGAGSLKSGVAALGSRAKTAVAGSMAALKSAAQGFGKLSLKSKLLGCVVLALLGLTVVVVKLTFSGRFLPTMEMHYLKSFADVADARFTYPPDEPMEDFNNPLLHPEHVVLVERIIANLKPTGPDENPMAMLEVYIEGATKEAAIEIKDRESEVRDVVSRILEQMEYDELVSPAGKTKLKNFLRKSLNGFLSQGRIRRVYFKTIVLKP